MKTRMSIRPGATILPAQPTMSVLSGTPAAPMPRRASRITPSTIRTSPGPSKSLAGSMTRAFASRIGRRSVSMPVIPASSVRQVAGERLQHRHTHRHSHFHLFPDQRLRAVGHDGVDLDTAGPRTGMHHERVRLGVGELLLVQPEIVEVLAGRGYERAVHAVALEAHHHDDVGDFH